MNWRWKVSIVAAVLALIAALLLIIKYQYDAMEKQEAIANSLVEQKQLTDKIARAQAQYVTEKSLEAYAKSLDTKLKPIRDDLKKLDGEIKGVGAVKVVTVGYKGKDISSDTSVPRPKDEQPLPGDDLDPWNYQRAQQKLKLSEPFTNDQKVPWGEVGFKAWEQEPWDLVVHSRNYQVVNVLGQDEEGRHYVYNKFSIEVEGKKYDIKIDDSKFVEEYPKSKFRLSPSLYLGVGTGVYLTEEPQWAVTPNIQMFIASYGRTKLVPEWVFLGVGLGYEALEQRFNFLLSPVGYNIGTHIPLIKNLYIVPTVTIDPKGDFTILGGVSVGL